MTEDVIKSFGEAKKFCFRQHPLSQKNEVRDHCHLTGNHPGSAHISCNSHVKKKIFIFCTSSASDHMKN